MNDPLTWSPISLGRWFGTTVRVHILLILFVAFRLLWSAVALAAEGKLPELSQTACWLGLLLIALAIHELAHAATAYWLDCDQEDVHLWPLGNLVGPSYVPRSGEHFLVAMAGPFTSGAIFLMHGDRAERAGRRPGRLESVRQYHRARQCLRGDHRCTLGPPWGGDGAGQSAQSGLDHRLVRLPELGLDARQPDPGAPIRRRPDAPCRPGQYVGRLVPG